MWPNQELDPLYLNYLEGLERGNEPKFIDDRWQTELNRYDLFVIDVFGGRMNAAANYQRDQFTASELDEFRERLINDCKDREIWDRYREMVDGYTPESSG